LRSTVQYASGIFGPWKIDVASTGCLFYEGWYIPQHFEYGFSVGYRLLCGALLGVLFIKFTKVYLEDYGMWTQGLGCTKSSGFTLDTF
jgi:hypothetical protein